MAGSRTSVRVGVEIDGPDLSEITPWDEVAMRGLCEQVNAMVLVRAQRDRQLATGNSMDSIPYSTKATTISFKSETSRRLKAKGGKPSLNAAGVETGKRYEGGYAQYKRDSSGAPGVDLTLSGQMFRSFSVKQVTAEEGRIGLDGQAAEYGTHVDAQRPWIGLTPKELDAVTDIIDEEAGAAMQRNVAGT